MYRKDYYYDENAPVPHNLVPAVSAVVLDKEKNKILLQQRVDNGKWSLAGGKVEPGETVEQAVIREVEEESGLQIEVTKLTGVYSDPNHVIAYKDGEVRQQFSICFFCKIIGGVLIKSEESRTVDFIPIGELDSLDIHETQKIRIHDALSDKCKAFIR